LKPSPFATAARASLHAGALTGLFFGALDGAMAVAHLGLRAPEGLALLGCLAAGVTIYGIGATALAFTAAVLLPWLRRGDLPTCARRLLGLLFALGIFFEVYWWTRPFIYPGLPAASPRRLAAALGLLVASALAAGLVVAVLGRLTKRLGLAGALTLPLVWVAGLFFLLVDSGRGADKGELNDRNRDLPNVLIFVVDALRHDVLEPYGGDRVATPNTTRLAERGVVFENAFAQAPFTWTSFGSILTGKYPLRHGLISMAPGVQMVPSVTIPWHLKTARRKDGRQLTAEDYVSATFMTGTLSNDSGLMRGFDSYSELLDGHDLVNQDSAWSVFRSELLAYRVRNKLNQRVDASLVVSTAIRWLRRHEGRRFAAMVHLYSTHTPYDPEPDFRDAYVDPDYDGRIPAFYAEHRIAIEEGAELRPEDAEQIVNLYHGGTSQADARVGLVLDELERQGVLDDTLVIFTSDHGEELGDHGLWEHNWMFETNLQIPLILSWPAGLPQGQRVNAMVESVDLLPTVCDLLELELPEADDEYAVVDGRSLVPLMRGDADRIREHSFALNPNFMSIRSERFKLIVPFEAVEGEPQDWSSRWQGSLQPRLYALGDDPGERHSLLPTSDPELQAEATRLFQALAAWDASQPIPRHNVVKGPRDLEDARLLGDLGYGEGVEIPGGGAGEGRE